MLGTEPVVLCTGRAEGVESASRKDRGNGEWQEHDPQAVLLEFQKVDASKNTIRQVPLSEAIAIVDRFVANHHSSG
jgi:hypothetical protein